MIKWNLYLSDKRDDSRDEAHQVYSMVIIAINMLDKMSTPGPAVGPTQDAQIAHLINARRKLGDVAQDLVGYISCRERMNGVKF